MTTPYRSQGARDEIAKPTPPPLPRTPSQLSRWWRKHRNAVVILASIATIVGVLAATIGGPTILLIFVGWGYLMTKRRR